MACSPIERHVVLVAPEIHWNTGNIGRSCLGAGAFLHLIKPLGFSIDDKMVKRAGLDYWPRVNLTVWNDFSTLKDHFRIIADEVALFTKTGASPVWKLPSRNRLFLIFGSETEGLPAWYVQTFGRASTYHIPIRKEIRSLNLSTAVGIALYESLRNGPVFHEWC